jgi:glucosamine--fructose-6-phosphate aminotransferase (isomerizing)
MKHGPIALIDDKMPVVVIVTKKGYDKILSNIQEVKSRGGKLIIISTIDSEDLRKLATDFLYLEGATDLHNSLTPILTSIPLQLLSYHIATLKGCDVDQPRNLAKSVTVE